MIIQIFKAQFVFICLLGFLNQGFVFAAASGKDAKKMVIVPGKSMGEVSIGETREALLKKGFRPDDVRDPQNFLKNSELLVRLISGKVVQIWFQGRNVSHLELRGQRFPADWSPKSLRKFFKDCEPDVRGSGGILIYCEKRGIELAYSFLDPKSPPSIAIVTPEVVAQVLGQ